MQQDMMKFVRNPEAKWKIYHGVLGEFTYDENLFRIVMKRIPTGMREVLQYIGRERDGRLIQIPDGVVDLSYTFEGKSIATTPEIPLSVKYMDYTFADCLSLLTGAGLPYGLERAAGLYHGCRMLVTGSHQPDTLIASPFMYEGCWNLQDGGNLSVNLLDAQGMYQGCKNLQVLPKLPECLVNDENMFRGCEELIRQERHLMY